MLIVEGSLVDRLFSFLKTQKKKPVNNNIVVARLNSIIRYGFSNERLLLMKILLSWNDFLGHR
jgi:hypothetical protein